MAWIPSFQELRYHPKTMALSRALGEPKAHVIGYLHCLWWWALDYTEDGNLSKYPPDVIADAAEFSGDGAQLLDALCRAGFVDHTETGAFRIHDWDEYLGRLLDKREANAARQRQRRASNALVTRDTHVSHNAREQNRTEQNTTEKPPDPPSAGAAARPRHGQAKKRPSAMDDPEARAAAKAVYDIMAAKGTAPSAKDWWPRACTEYGKLTLAAKASLATAVGWAVNEPGKTGEVLARDLSRCRFAEVVDAYRAHLNGARGSPHPSVPEFDPFHALRQVGGVVP